MLFTYDARANLDNWIHSTVIDIIATAFEAIDANIDYSPWPELIPEARRPLLSSRTSLKKSMCAFLNAYKGLNQNERLVVRTAATDQNDLKSLFDNTKTCVKASDLPESIRAPALRLFTAAFKLLTPLKLRDQHYKKIHRKMRDKVCPFCGCEPLDPPGLARHDLDHYLARTIYPFAAVNLNNLAPMGDRCNKSYKKQKDMLLRDGGGTRKCSDPFHGPTATVSLNQSVPFQRKKGTLPAWVIDLQDDCEEMETWDAVFSIKKRWSNAVLDQEYRGWLDDFSRWSKGTWIPAEVKNSIPELLLLYVDASVPERFSDRSFLKRATFTMLCLKCDDPEHGEDLRAYLKDIIDLP